MVVEKSKLVEQVSRDRVEFAAGPSEGNTTEEVPDVEPEVVRLTLCSIEAHFVEIRLKNRCAIKRERRPDEEQSDGF